MAEKCHPGITMHKLSFGGGFVGLLLAFALGIGVAVLLRIVSKGRSERNKPLSILAVPDASEAHKRGERIRWHKSFKVLPGLTSA